MTKAKRQRADYLTRRIAGAKNVLADPGATDVQRHGARCRLNRAVDVLNRLRPIPPIGRAKRELLFGVEEEAEIAA